MRQSADPGAVTELREALVTRVSEVAVVVVERFVDLGEGTRGIHFQAGKHFAERQLFADPLQQAEVAAPLFAEAEGRADVDLLQRQLAVQEAAHEVLGLGAGKVLREADDQHDLDDQGTGRRAQ